MTTDGNDCYESYEEVTGETQTNFCGTLRSIYHDKLISNSLRIERSTDWKVNRYFLSFF